MKCKRCQGEMYYKGVVKRTDGDYDRWECGYHWCGNTKEIKHEPFWTDPTGKCLFGGYNNGSNVLQ